MLCLRAPPLLVTSLPLWGLVFHPNTPTLDTFTNNGPQVAASGSKNMVTFPIPPRRPRPRVQITSYGPSSRCTQPPASSVSLQTPPDAHGPTSVKVLSMDSGPIQADLSLLGKLAKAVTLNCPYFVGCLLPLKNQRLRTANLRMRHGLSGKHHEV